MLEGGDWNAQSGESARWEPNRLFSDPPQALVNQLLESSSEVYAECGIPSGLFRDSHGTAAREAWRQVLFGVISPLGRIVQHELALKLDAPELALSWDELRASDMSGRARAFQSLVGAGMDVEQAVTLSGVLSPDT